MLRETFSDLLWFFALEDLLCQPDLIAKGKTSLGKMMVDQNANGNTSIDCRLIAQYSELSKDDMLQEGSEKHRI